MFNRVGNRKHLCSLEGLELLCTGSRAFASFNIPSCQAVFCEALVPVHLAVVCVPLHFAVFVHAPVPVHALS